TGEPQRRPQTGAEPRVQAPVEKLLNATPLGEVGIERAPQHETHGTFEAAPTHAAFRARVGKPHQASPDTRAQLDRNAHVLLVDEGGDRSGLAAYRDQLRAGEKFHGCAAKHEALVLWNPQGRGL